MQAFYFMKTDLPKELTPINLRRYFHDAFHLCGCMDIVAIIDEIRVILSWCNTHISFESTYKSLDIRDGIYYLIIAQLESVNLVIHHTSARWPCITPEGEQLLNALINIRSIDIDEAEGIDDEGNLWEK